MTPETQAAIIGGVAGALVGAFATLLVDRWGVHRARLAASAQALALAFWEELSATHFTQWPGPTPYWEANGFSSQTFDTQFALMAEALPTSLQVSLMRYHWRLKYLEGFRKTTSQYPPGDMANEARLLREELLARLRAYADRDLVDLFINREEERV